MSWNMKERLFDSSRGRDCSRLYMFRMGLSVCPLGAEGYRGVKRRDMRFTSDLCLVARLNIRGALSPFFHTSFWRGVPSTRTSLRFVYGGFKENHYSLIPGSCRNIDFILLI